MYTVKNTLSGATISRHRNLANAVKAEDEIHRKLQFENGPMTFIPTAIVDSYDDHIAPGHEEYEEMLWIANRLPYWNYSTLKA